MSLEIGQKLGPYEIIEQAGAGGMGEVYKAKDTRLDRTVAVKILPASIAGSAEFRERFEREAKAISKLSHPNICSLFDVGHEDGVEFIVMEFLEGETLGDRLSKGKLSSDEVLHFSVEIADALEHAHKSGIIHRDLKPGNVMLTPSGVKILDFGLAKMVARAAGPSTTGLSAVLTEDYYGKISNSRERKAALAIQQLFADAENLPYSNRTKVI